MPNKNDAERTNDNTGNSRCGIVRHSTLWVLCRMRHSTHRHSSIFAAVRPAPQRPDGFCGRFAKGHSLISNGFSLITQDGAVPSISRTSAAEDAGLSERQRKTALRVANVPKEEFRCGYATTFMTVLILRARKSTANIVSVWPSH